MNSIQILLISAIDVFFQVIEWLILARIIMSWLPIGHGTVIGNFLGTMTDPILLPCRDMISNSPLGRGMMLDFSPIIALFILSIIKGMLQGVVILLLV